MTPETSFSTRRRLALVIGGAVVLLLMIVLALAGHHTTNKNPSGTLQKSHTSYDTNSGDTTRTIEGENNQGVAGNVPTFLGVSALLDRGITSDQLANMQTAFLHYSVAKSLTIKQVSITVNSITASSINPDSDNPINVLNFPVVFDGKTTVNASLHYSGLSSTELFLSDTSGQQLFDSGIIDVSTGD